MVKVVGPKTPAVKTIKRLFALSSNRCAFSGCSTSLVDPNSGSILGEVCHIKGDKSTAARYDKNQSNAERHDFGNLILADYERHNSPSITVSPATSISFRYVRVIRSCGSCCWDHIRFKIPIVTGDKRLAKAVQSKGLEVGNMALILQELVMTNKLKSMSVEKILQAIADRKDFLLGIPRPTWNDLTDYTFPD